MYKGKSRVMFLYWGRRGALTCFVRELGRAAVNVGPAVTATLSVSRQNEGFAELAEFEDILVPVSTFDSGLGMVTQAWRIPIISRQIVKRLRNDHTQAAIALMPHVWLPFVAPAIKATGVRYATIVHDANPHIGDPTSAVNRLLLRGIHGADSVVTLSSAVAAHLVEKGLVSMSRVHTLFHPDLPLGTLGAPMGYVPGQPFRLLFLGRILPYKGLPLLLDAVEILKEQGLSIHLGVYGEGPLGANAEQLRRIGAEVENRWLSEREIAGALDRFHAVALSHIEASQSGVAAVAFGSGLPVIATPVGGLVEQVVDGKTGILATQANPQAFARAIRRFIDDPQEYAAVRQYLRTSGGARSMERFLTALVSTVLESAN